jgi:hypothetical protein
VESSFYSNQRKLQQEEKDFEDLRLRFNMPAALCSYCLGEIRIGSKFQMGNTRRMDFNEE